MIASRRKAQRLREVMRMRGIDELHLGRLTAPAGPDAGAKTPGEIALVAIVGVLAVLRGRAQATPDAKAGDASVPAPLQSSSHNAVDAAAPSTKFVNPVCGIAVDTATPN
jgi:xanthine dehydrogenase accessory factor